VQKTERDCGLLECDTVWSDTYLLNYRVLYPRILYFVTDFTSTNLGHTSFTVLWLVFEMRLEWQLFQQVACIHLFIFAAKRAVYRTLISLLTNDMLPR
jgi:hypothetical protein